MCGVAAFLFGFILIFFLVHTLPIIHFHSGHSSGNALTSSPLDGIVFLLYCVNHRRKKKGYSSRLCKCGVVVKIQLYLK